MQRERRGATRTPKTSSKGSQCAPKTDPISCKPGRSEANGHPRENNDPEWTQQGIKGRQKRPQRESKWDPRDEMEADMGTKGVPKGVQLGDSGEDQNRAPAAARARSSMSKPPQKEDQNWVVHQEHRNVGQICEHGGCRTPREPKMEPKATWYGHGGALAARRPQP